jgi:hypothetical protein
MFHCKVTRRPPHCKGFQKIFPFSSFHRQQQKANICRTLPLPGVATAELSKAVKIFPTFSQWRLNKGKEKLLL